MYFLYVDKATYYIIVKMVMFSKCPLKKLVVFSSIGRRKQVV